MMSNAKPKSVAHKRLSYQNQRGPSTPLTPAQERQLRRTENHLLASARKRRSQAAKKAAATRRQKKAEQALADMLLSEGEN